MRDAVRLLVIGDDGIFPGGVSRLLAHRDDLSLVATVGDADEAAGVCRARRVDVALIDLDRLGIDGIAATHGVLSACPEAKVLVVADLQSPRGIAAALAAGACGFVPRTPPPGDLHAVVSRAAAGEFVMPVGDLPNVVGELGDAAAPAEADDALGRLTNRETEILTSIADGESTDEIATHLRISRLTVQSHVKSILAKLGVHSKVEAVTVAWRRGLIPISPRA
jgi:DNA-binding NarL/FixJ family response regulator